MLKNYPEYISATGVPSTGNERAAIPADSTLINVQIYQDWYTHELEDRLKALKLKLNSAYELQDAYNEHMQLFKEELISANEKMHSINKEMQSVNEELHLINSDYLQKNIALLELNDNLKNTQAELGKKNLSLVKINEDQDNFIYAVSHDLLGPLGNIEASLNGLSQKVNDDDFQLYLHVINSSIKKFGALIRDIGTIAKFESDMIAMEMVDLDDILTNIEWSLANKIELSGAVIVKELNVKEVLFSKKNLRSILYNLISNAIKFKGSEAPLIHLHSSTTIEGTVLIIQDNGKGMSPADLDKIFDIYGRLNKDIEGTGVGLYLAKKMLDTAGGSITVESELDKGTRFTIFLQHQKS